MTSKAMRVFFFFFLNFVYLILVSYVHRDDRQVSRNLLVSQYFVDDNPSFTFEMLRRRFRVDKAMFLLIDNDL